MPATKVKTSKKSETVDKPTRVRRAATTKVKSDSSIKTVKTVDEICKEQIPQCSETYINTLNQDSGSIGLRKTISTLAEFNAMIDARIYGGEYIRLDKIMDERLKVLGY